MSTVGVRQLKNNLSSYINRVRHGEGIIITERKKPVAYIIPIEQEGVMEDVSCLIREGVITWGGGKPKGNLESPVISGKLTSKIVLEGRR